MGLRLEKVCEDCVGILREMSRISYEVVVEGMEDAHKQLSRLSNSLKKHVQKIENFMELEEFLYLLIIAIGQQAYEMQGEHWTQMQSLEFTLDQERKHDEERGQWEARRILNLLTVVTSKNEWSTHLTVAEGVAYDSAVKEFEMFSLRYERCNVKSKEDIEARRLEDGFDRMLEDHCLEPKEDPEEADRVCVKVTGTSGAIASWILHRHTPLVWVDKDLLEELRLERPLPQKSSTAPM